jgi:hypothetical protein
MVNAGDGRNFRIVPGGEDFIRLLKISIREDFFNHGHAIVSEQADHSLPGDAG